MITNERVSIKTVKLVALRQEHVESISVSSAWLGRYYTGQLTVRAAQRAPQSDTISAT